jgi:Ribosomal protein L28
MSQCEICKKGVSFGKKVSIARSHVSRRANHMQKPNVKRVKVDFNGTAKSMYVCTRCLRSNKVTRIRN